jgi:predicted PurR-regulated permease PerM
MESIFTRLNDSKWIILGALLILLLLWIAWPFFDVLVFAVFFYYVARPILKRLRPYIKNETLLVLACLFLLILPLILVMGYVMLLAVSQANSLVQYVSAQSLPAGPLSNTSSVISGIQSRLAPENFNSENIGSTISDLFYRAQAVLKSTSGVHAILIAMGTTLVDLIFRAFLMMAIVFYLLRDDNKIKIWFMSTFPALVAQHDHLLARFSRAVDDDLEKVFFGNILSIVIFAAIAAIVYSILNFFAPDRTLFIPYPLLMGVLLGVAALLPLVGAWTVDIPIMLFILVRSLMAGTFFTNIGFFALMAAVIFIFVETLPGYVLRPFISHGQVNVGLLMFAYILGPIVFGISGLFLSVIVLVLLTHYFKIVVPQLAKDRVNDQGN